LQNNADENPKDRVMTLDFIWKMYVIQLECDTQKTLKSFNNIKIQVNKRFINKQMRALL